MDLVGEKQSKRRKCKLEEDQPENWIHSLPHDIAIEILSRLPVTSLIQFKFVSQASKILTNDPHLVKLHLSRTAKNTPCLIFHSDNPIRNQLYFVDLSDHEDQTEIVRKIQTPFPASMPEFNVVGSCNGLLFLSDSLFDGSLYVYNPFTRKHKELPKSIQFEEQELMFGFGFHPVTKEYKVIKIIYYDNAYNAHNRPWRYSRFRMRDFPHSEVQILSLSSNTWRSTGKVPYQLDRRSSEALVNGRLHWVTRRMKDHGVCGRIIVSFDLADEQFREVPRADNNVFLNRGKCHLTVLGGCLSVAVPLNYGRLEIWIMKEYNVRESWIKQYDIAAVLPKNVDQDLTRPYAFWKNVMNKRIVRILCLLKNGKILLEYRGGNLVSYDPESETFEVMMFQGMPNLSQTLVHVGSLNWIDNPTEL